MDDQRYSEAGGSSSSFYLPDQMYKGEKVEYILNEYQFILCIVSPHVHVILPSFKIVNIFPTELKNWQKFNSNPQIAIGEIVCTLLYSRLVLIANIELNKF